MVMGKVTMGSRNILEKFGKFVHEDVSISFVDCDFVAQFCTCSIYYTQIFTVFTVQTVKPTEAQ